MKKFLGLSFVVLSSTIAYAADTYNNNLKATFDDYFNNIDISDPFKDYYSNNNYDQRNKNEGLQSVTSSLAAPSASVDNNIDKSAVVSPEYLEQKDTGVINPDSDGVIVQAVASNTDISNTNVDQIQGNTNADKEFSDTSFEKNSIEPQESLDQAEVSPSGSGIDAHVNNIPKNSYLNVPNTLTVALIITGVGYYYKKQIIDGISKLKAKVVDYFC